MIRSFADRRTKGVFEDVPVKGLGPEVRRAARKKLLMLNRATSLQDLRVPPGNRLEGLVGNRAGQHSIRINRQWRICSSGMKGTRTTCRSWIIIEERKR